MNKTKEKIASFYEKRKRMPTYHELVDILGYKSKGAVHYTLPKFIESGFLARDPATGRLIPGAAFRETGKTRLLGLVEAGFPSAAEEELLDVMSFDDYLVPNKEASYILKVKGDSMIDAGICDGDMVIVEKRAVYKPGQIVVASIDGEYTMKYLRKEGGEMYLEPANKNYKPIHPKQNLEITAVVTAVVRKY